MSRDSRAREHSKFFDVVGSPQGSEFLLHSGSRALCGDASEDMVLPNEHKRRARECDISESRDARPRAFDPLLNCWIAAPPTDIPGPRRRVRRLPVSIGDRSQNWWWIVDQVTGRRVLRIERLSKNLAQIEAKALFPNERTYVVADGVHRQGALQAALMSIINK